MLVSQSASSSQQPRDKMDSHYWASSCIETSLSKLTLSTKCIKQSASFLLSMSEHADLISRLWIKTFKTANEPALQLSLLYVLNEIFAKATSYGTPEIKNNFMDSIVEAIEYVRPGPLVRKVKKLVYIWATGGYFEDQFNKQLFKLAKSLDESCGSTEKTHDSEEVNTIKDFMPSHFIEQLNEYNKITESLKYLSESELIPPCFNPPIESVLSRVRSKEEGKSCSEQVNKCIGELEDAINSVKRKHSSQKDLLSVFDQAVIYYSVQQKEAEIVVKAYKSYENQVRETLSSVGGEPEDVNAGSNTQQMPFGQSDYYDPPSCGDSDMSDVEEYEDKPLVVFRRAYEDLIDPKSLSHLPFSDSILIDAYGDVDYRPMLAKLSSQPASDKKDAVKPTPMTETGDFDYRNPPVDKDLRIPNAFGVNDVHSSGNISGSHVSKSETYSPPYPLPSSQSEVDTDYRKITPHPADTLTQLPLEQQQQQASAPLSDFSWLNRSAGDIQMASSGITQSALINSEDVKTPKFTSPPPQPPYAPQPVLGSVYAFPPPATPALNRQGPPPPLSGSLQSPPPPKHFQQQQQTHSTLTSSSSATTEQPFTTSKDENNSQASSSSADHLPKLSVNCLLTAENSNSTQAKTTTNQEIKPDDVVPKQEDPFSIISRLTGLSNLIHSMKSKTFETPPGLTILASSLQANREDEPAVSQSEPPAVAEPSEAVASSNSHATPENDADQNEDGGATPTQDEAGALHEGSQDAGFFPFTVPPGLAPSVLPCGPAGFALLPPTTMQPPPILGNQKTNLLAFSMGMPPPFNQLGGAGLNVSMRAPWQLGPPPNNATLAGSLQPPNGHSFFNVVPLPMNRPPFSSNANSDEGK